MDLRGRSYRSDFTDIGAWCDVSVCLLIDVIIISLRRKIHTYARAYIRVYVRIHFTRIPRDRCIRITYICKLRIERGRHIVPFI